MLPPFSYGIKYYADDKNDVKQNIVPTNNWLIRLTKSKQNMNAFSKEIKEKVEKYFIDTTCATNTSVTLNVE